MVNQYRSNPDDSEKQIEQVEDWRYPNIHPKVQTVINGLRELYNTLDLGIIVSDIEGRYLFVSHGIEEYIGIPEKEFMGKKPSEISDSPQNEIIIKQLQDVLDGIEPYKIRFSVEIHKTGEKMMLEKIANPLKDTNGKIIAIISTYTDITREKKLEKTIEKRKRKSIDAERESGVGTVTFDLKNGTWKLTETSNQIFGFKEEGLINYSEFLSIISQDDKDRVNNYFLALMRGENEKIDIEYRVIREIDGEEKWVHLISELQFDGDNEVIYSQGIVQDITQKKKNEEEYREITNLHLSIANSTKDFISTIDIDGKFTFVNPALAKFLGLSESEIKGKTMCEILEIDSKPLRETIEKIIETKSHVLKEEEVINKTGEKKILSIMRGPIFDSEGNVKALFSICRDMTDIRIKENELNETQKQLKLREKMALGGEILAGVAHDLNNILTPIMGYADMALLSKGLPDTIIEYLKNVKRASIRARDLVTQLKQMTKNTNIEKSDFDIYEVISEVFKLLINTTNRLVHKQILIEKGFHNIIGNKSELHQVFMNLGVNSVQAMAERGVKDGDFIKVVAENTTILKDNSFGIQEGNYVHITFEDNGSGMTPEVLEKAFSPFFTTKGNNGGTGIGLATVFNIIVQNHNGAIYIESTKDVGTKIHIYLPSTNQSEWINKDRKVEMLGGSETILIIDDEEVICNMLKDLLEYLGYKVIVAKNGKEGIDIIQSNPNIDLISLDLDMPGMSGEQLLESLPEGYKTKVIVSSGYSQSLKPELLSKIGGLVDKPFNINKITTIIRKLLDEKKI